MCSRPARGLPEPLGTRGRLIDAGDATSGKSSELDGIAVLELYYAKEHL